jgi:AcrR family transcriptional regulator
MTTEVPHLRVDAQDNRDRILLVARELFADRGLDIGMREIARAADVGPATLYRRFPTKQDLIDEAFQVELQACRAIVEKATTASSPWNGFADAIRALIALNARNRGFVDAFTREASSGPVITAHRRELLAILAGVTRRAIADGALRDDFRIEDLVLILRAGRAAASEREAARFADLALNGLQPGALDQPLHSPLALVDRPARS